MWSVLTALSIAAAAPPNLVVISLDTTRADALSCYGPPERPVYDATPSLPRTPHLDRLAAEGVRFERFYAQSPSTLASHATLFTGRDPHGTLVARNGYPLDPSLNTLAGRLRDAGYATRAVIGAAALEAGTGIERGFDVWDDATPQLAGLMYQAPAPDVVRRAELQLDAWAGDRPLFLFVHFFDVHAPYDPPEPYRSRFLDPAYDGPYTQADARLRPVVAGLIRGERDEDAVRAINGRYYGGAAWVDHHVGALLETLGQRGVLDDALVVVVADHGEVLDERPHYAWTHGSDVSEGVTRVPLLMRATGSAQLAERAVVERQANMAALPATIERALGLEPTLGDDLWALVRPGPRRDDDGWPERPTRTVLQEATRPRNHERTDGWNNLPFERAVLAGGWRLDRWPLRGDHVRLSPKDEPLREVLRAILDAWDAAAPGHQQADMAEHQVRALKALGYLQDDP